MQINWRIRFKKKTFILAFTSVILRLLNQIAALFGYDISSFSEQAADLFETVTNILAFIGVVDDPTVRGMLIDSETSMMKEEPTDPKQNLEVKGEEVITDETEIIVDNTETEYPASAGPERWSNKNG